jgi:hypothetical protein
VAPRAEGCRRPGLENNGKVLIIECKRLQLAMTVAEIAEICQRFRGEARGELDKHLKRVNWIRENPFSLKGIVGFQPGKHNIDDRLVTNTHVSMMYLASLPIQANKISLLQYQLQQLSLDGR